MRAILICVDFADMLAITLPYNRGHFSDVMVVTTSEDLLTKEVARKHNCSIYETNSFYYKGAAFAKWRALEEGLSVFGRHCIDPLDNWLMLLDVDILLPKYLKVHTYEDRVEYETPTSIFTQEMNQLCSPLRHMMIDLPIPFTKESIPREELWSRYAIHKNVNEHAGYSQIFNTYDKHLPKTPPWHEVDYIHAGIADSIFQSRWPVEMKVRPNWSCLHIGLPGINWLGRSSDYLDGTKNPDKQRLEGEILEIWRERRKRERSGHPDRFGHERIKE